MRRRVARRHRGKQWRCYVVLAFVTAVALVAAVPFFYHHTLPHHHQPSPTLRKAVDTMTPKRSAETGPRDAPPPAAIANYESMSTRTVEKQSPEATSPPRGKVLIEWRGGSPKFFGHAAYRSLDKIIDQLAKGSAVVLLPRKTPPVGNAAHPKSKNLNFREEYRVYDDVFALLGLALGMIVGDRDGLTLGRELGSCVGLALSSPKACCKRLHLRGRGQWTSGGQPGV